MSEEYIEVIARGVLVKDGSLLICRTKGAGNTYLPGGHIEFREDARGALVREIQEEMGCPAKAGGFLGVVEHSFIQGGRRHCELNLVFALEIDGISSKSNPPAREDYIEFMWLDLNELRSSNLEPYPLRAKISQWLESSDQPERWASTLC